MILNAFSLEGKVAVVTGCDTGLGQGMALGLAEAGCDIVGINIVEPTETIARVTALGRRFLSLTADLRQICNAANNFGLIHNQFRIAILAILDPELSAFFAKH